MRIPYKDLALTGQTPGRFLLTKVALAAGGLLLPPLSTIPFLILGMPLYLPAIVAVLAALVLWFSGSWVSSKCQPPPAGPTMSRSCAPGTRSV
ncbi:hypothetical protein ACWDA9_42125, partial [Streptomyces sp. NPDC001193]